MASKRKVPSHFITVAETPLFMRQAEDVWDKDEHAEFVNFIAANPETGDVIRIRVASVKCDGGEAVAESVVARA